MDGQIQAIDSAFVEANASLDTLEAKKLANWTLDVNQQVTQQTPETVTFVKANQFFNPKRITRNNRIYRSPTDPQSRLATKPGKPFRLYYLASMVVDSSQHVITHIKANPADEKDSRHLGELVYQTQIRLRRLGFPLGCVVADAGFGSGANYAALEQTGIDAYISPAGAYTPVGEPFSYEQEQDVYRCTHGAILKNHGIRIQKGYGSHCYISKASACKNCRSGDPTHKSKVLREEAAKNHCCNYAPQFL